MGDNFPYASVRQAQIQQVNLDTPNLNLAYRFQESELILCRFAPCYNAISPSRIYLQVDQVSSKHSHQPGTV